ncbi:hypothetical protein JCM15765_13100 [Paradesulfitobacterium aromaticivorans]
MRAVLHYVQLGAGVDVVRSVARKLRGEIKDICETGYMCYYR